MNRNTTVSLGRITIICSIVFCILALNIEDLLATQKDFDTPTAKAGFGVPMGFSGYTHPNGSR